MQASAASEKFQNSSQIFTEKHSYDEKEIIPFHGAKILPSLWCLLTARSINDFANYSLEKFNLEMTILDHWILSTVSDHFIFNVQGIQMVKTLVIDFLTMNSRYFFLGPRCTSTFDYWSYKFFLCTTFFLFITCPLSERDALSCHDNSAHFFQGRQWQLVRQKYAMKLGFLFTSCPRFWIVGVFMIVFGTIGLVGNVLSIFCLSTKWGSWNRH